MPLPPTFPMLVGGRLRRAAVAGSADLADAVTAARAAGPSWSGISVHERARVLFDLAEVLDERRDRLADDDTGPAEVATAVDRWLWYAGWADKLAGVAAAVHPVDGPYASFSTPRPLGVVGVVAGALHRLIDGLASALTVGATAVVVAPLDRPRAATAVAEILAESALPPGAANLLIGDVAALATELAGAAVDGLDLPDPSAEPVRAAADRGLRVLPATTADPGLARLRAWTEVTTVWQSVGR